MEWFSFGFGGDLVDKGWNNGATTNVSCNGVGDNDGWRLMVWWQLWRVDVYCIFWSNMKDEDVMFFMHGFFYPLVPWSKENE